MFQKLVAIEPVSLVEAVSYTHLGPGAGNGSFGTSSQPSGNAGSQAPSGTSDSEVRFEGPHASVSRHDAAFVAANVITAGGPGGSSGGSSSPGAAAPGGVTAGGGNSSGATVSYVDAIMNAASASGVNPYVIAAMIIQEQGRDGRGNSISGNYAGYTGVYNYFNVGAYASDGMGAVERGLWYASQSVSYTHLDVYKRQECEDDLNRICSDIENCVGATDLALAQISDDNFFMEVKKDYDPSMVTGFIRLNGMTVGCVANRTEVYGENGVKEGEYDAVLSYRGCEKAEKFVSFCDAFNIPLLTLVNVKGYKASKCTERRIAKAAGRLTYAFADASVPKVTVVVGEAYGSAYLTMNSKSIGADLVYAWPNASIGMMDAEAAAKIMYADEIAKADDSLALIAEKAEAYRQLQSSAVAAAKRGYVDDIIDACDTRKRVIAAFEMLFTKREDRPDRKHGTV